MIDFESPNKRSNMHRGHSGVGLPVRKGPGQRSDRGVVTQSALAALAGLARGALAGGLIALLGGCGMSSLTSGIGGGWFGSQNKTGADVGAISEDQLLAAAKTDGPGSGAGFDVAHGCPRFQVWSREGYVTIYDTGRHGDGRGAKTSGTH